LIIEKSGWEINAAEGRFSCREDGHEDQERLAREWRLSDRGDLRKLTAPRRAGTRAAVATGRWSSVGLSPSSAGSAFG
jgi:hypothetical protein